MRKRGAEGTARNGNRLVPSLSNGAKVPPTANGRTPVSGPLALRRKKRDWRKAGEGGKATASSAKAEKKKSRKKEEAPPPLTLYAVHTVLSLFFFGAPLSLSSCVFVLPAGRACVKSPFAAAAAEEEAAKTRGMEGKRGGLG